MDWKEIDRKQAEALEQEERRRSFLRQKKHKGSKGRSLGDDYNYEPDWRSTWADEYYLTCVEFDGDRVISARLPDHETDEWLIELFLYWTWGSCTTPERYALVNWAFRLNEFNSSNYGASNLKAFYIAGIPKHEIARRFNVSIDHINVFLKLFFDIEDYRHSETFMERLIFPPADKIQNDPAGNRERLLLCVAGILGEPGLKTVMSRRINFSQADMAMLDRVIKECLTASAFRYVLAMTSEPDARPNHLDKFNTMIANEALKQNPSSEGGSRANMLRALNAIFVKKTSEEEEKNPGNKAMALFAEATQKAIDIDAQVTRTTQSKPASTGKPRRVSDFDHGLDLSRHGEGDVLSFAAL